MIRSMTGYGRGEAGEGEHRYSIEVRSLNNRFLDVQVKVPRSLAQIEHQIRRSVQDRFSRGRFEVFVSRNVNRDQTGKLSFDSALAEQYIALLRELKSRYNLAGDIELSLVAGLQNLITVAEEKEDDAALWTVASNALVLALDGLDRMRAQEGAALVDDITMRLDTIGQLSEGIRKQTPVTLENARNRMQEALARLLETQPDPARLAQEIAILAERTDVTEELTRLGSHLKQFRAFLRNETKEAIGRKLDFLVQEMGREVNTIASKAMDARISVDVVHVKAELEKIREQVQNIE